MQDESDPVIRDSKKIATIYERIRNKYQQFEFADLWGSYGIFLIKFSKKAGPGIIRYKIELAADPLRTAKHDVEYFEPGCRWPDIVANDDDYEKVIKDVRLLAKGKSI